MRLQWQEIRGRAATFAVEWKDARYERGETQSFFNAFFRISCKEARGQERASLFCAGRRLTVRRIDRSQPAMLVDGAGQVGCR